MTFSIKEHVSLKQYSTFAIGGSARFLVEITTQEDLKESLQWAKTRSLPILCVGKGSNSLFHDDGFCGLVVVNRISFVDSNGKGVFHVGAGMSFSSLGRLTAKDGWSGLEFAAGIPASVGGAIFMNAGAQAQETKDTLVQVVTMTSDGEVCTYQKSELNFGYRSSSFQKKQEYICSATFRLIPSERAFADLQEKIAYRLKTQPYSEKSIGCIFRNPEGRSAGRLIEEAGLKGFSYGGAQVSTIHANFIVNTGKATAEDVRTLAQKVVELVKQTSGIQLESEARMIDPQGRILPLL